MNKSTAVSEEEFRRTVSNAIEVLGVDALCGMFGVSPGTIQRWIKGKSVPHPFSRRSIVERLKERIKNEKK